MVGTDGWAVRPPGMASVPCQTKVVRLLTLPDGGVGSLSERVQGREELLALATKQPGASQRRNSCLRTG